MEIFFSYTIVDCFIISSYIFFRLSSCQEGFGDIYCNVKQREGEFDLSAGFLSLSFSSDSNSQHVVDEIATLLTSGRMSEENKKLLRNAYDAEEDKEKALRRVQQLAITAPEYHAIGLVRQKNNFRPLPVTNKKTCKPYKAVIHLMLYGGMDSFNLLVPHSNCLNNIGKLKCLMNCKIRSL